MSLPFFGYEAFRELTRKLIPHSRAFLSRLASTEPGVLMKGGVKGSPSVPHSIDGMPPVFFFMPYYTIYGPLTQ
jgi:hypothetical protein